ncbi:hypothetical protein DXG01_006717 [Tephrocybe rancida]|nr:hypothetical protein DXG01_006717 [Tephrocybe rancida]
MFSIYVLLLVIPRLFFQTSALKRTDVTPNSDGSRFFKPFRDMLDPQLDWALIRHRTWGLLYVIFCVGVNLTRHLGKAGYISLTFADPATPSLIQLDTRPDYKVWIGLLVCSALIYECVLHRHAAKRREIMHQLAGDRKTLLMVRPLSKRVRWGFTATWFLATKLHPWLPFFYASVMFLNWSMDMKIWTIENDFEWTYGQCLECISARRHTNGNWASDPLPGVSSNCLIHKYDECPQYAPPPASEPNLPKPYSPSKP